MASHFLQSSLALPLTFLGLGILSILPMKFLSLSKVSSAERNKIASSFLLSPLYSVWTWKKVKPATSADFFDLLRQFFRFFLPFIAVFLAYRTLMDRFEITLIGKSYLAVFPFYYLTESAGTLLQILFLGTGYLLPPTHFSPLKSQSLSDFWGRSWNPWMANWLKQMIYLPLHQKPVVGILAVFLFSGLWHEMLINLPFYLLRGIPLFGTMTAYFLIQGTGVILDRKFVEHGPAFLRVIGLWVFVILPVPLFLNEATLRIFLLD